MKTLLLHLFVSAWVAVIGIVSYEQLVARPARRIAVVDASAMYLAKQQQLSLRLAGSRSDQEREETVRLARAYGEAFPAALAQVARDCACLLLDRAALACVQPQVDDLTPLLQKKVAP